MAWTLDDYNALKSAIGTGAMAVYYGDKRVEYRTLSEMYRIKADMEKELGLTTTKPTRKYGEFKSGLNS